jgi:hypothetical protein
MDKVVSNAAEVIWATLKPLQCANGGAILHATYAHAHTRESKACRDKLLSDPTNVSRTMSSALTPTLAHSDQVDEAAI